MQLYAVIGNMQKEARPFINEQLIETVPDVYKALIGKYVKVLEPVDIFYQLQEQKGFYPKDLTPQEIQEIKKSSVLISPYNRVIRQEGKLQATRYVDDPDFRPLLNDIANSMQKAVNVLQYNHGIPQGYIIESSLRAQAAALREGNFEQAIIARLGLNITEIQDYSLFLGLLDRYLDPQFGAKFAMQGWILKKDRGLTREYSRFAGSSVLEPGKPQHRVAVGYNLGSAGLARVRFWNANTIPSEDRLRVETISESDVFIDNLMSKYGNSIKPSIEEYAPDYVARPGFDQDMIKAIIINLIKHERGHSMVNLPSNAERVVKGDYIPIKELMCEVIGQKDTLEQPDCDFDADPVRARRIKELVLLGSFVWSLDDIKSWKEEADSLAKTVKLAYAKAGAMGVNYHSRYKSLDIDSKRKIVDINIDNARQVANQMLNVLNDAMRNASEKLDIGSVARFIKINLRSPHDFLNGGLPDGSSDEDHGPYRLTGPCIQNSSNAA